MVRARFFLRSKENCQMDDDPFLMIE